MNMSFEARLDGMRSEMTPLEIGLRYYGLNLAADVNLREQLEGWASRFRRDEGPVITAAAFDRISLERYMRFASVRPLNWAAAYHGMSAARLREVLDALARARLLVWAHDGLSSQLVPKQVVEDLHTYFPELQSRTFSSHTDLCRRLHSAIRSDLGIQIEAVVDEASQIVEPSEEPDFAAALDVLTDEPIGLRYQVWLNLGKPLSLEPDACSILTYARHEAVLRNLLMTSRPPVVPLAVANLVREERGGT